VAGQHTATGKPILVNDPHLGLNAPILWYLARIVTPELTLTGATVPGVPLHVLGHNGRIAWGFTTTGTDVQDLFVEKVDPADSRRYLTEGGSVSFTNREEVIRVRFGEDVRMTVRATRHGPVISDIDERAREAAGQGNAIALAFTGLAGDDTTGHALYRLNRARNWDEFRDALRLHHTPQQNVVFADIEGNTGFISPARVPIRSRGIGRYPVPGWTGDYEWTGFVPFEALPQAFNPPSGRIVNANNAVVGPDYPYFLTRDWEEPYRAERIEQLLSGQKTLYAIADGERMVMDSVSLAARDLLPLLLSTQSQRAASRRSLELLRNWDGFAGRDRPEPLIFAAWLRTLGRTLYADELGAAVDDFSGLQPRTVKRMLSEKTAWCDDVDTEVLESCADMLTRSLDGAVEDLARRHGEDVASWRWGAAHRAPFAHTPIGFVPVLRDLLDIGIDTDGDSYTVNRGASYGEGPTPFAHRHGAGYRAVYDLADLDNSRFMIATGQSGNPLSPRYGDYVRRWRDGEHFRVAGSKEELAKRALGRLVLEPRETP
jgi:penicillin amidase